MLGAASQQAASPDGRHRLSGLSPHVALSLGHGRDDELLQNRQVDVSEFPDGQACLGHLVFAKSGEQRVAPRKLGDQIDTDVGLAG